MTTKKLQRDVRAEIRALEEKALAAIADRLRRYDVDTLVPTQRIEKMLLGAVGVESTYDWRITDRSPLNAVLKLQAETLARELTDRLSSREAHENIAKMLMRRPKFIVSAQKIYTEALEKALMAEVERRAKQRVMADVDALVEGISGVRTSTGAWSDNSDLTFDLESIFTAALVGESAIVEGYTWVDVGDTIRSQDVLYDRTIVDVNRMMRANAVGIVGNKVTAEHTWLRQAA